MNFVAELNCTSVFCKAVISCMCCDTYFLLVTKMFFSQCSDEYLLLRERQMCVGWSVAAVNKWSQWIMLYWNIWTWWVSILKKFTLLQVVYNVWQKVIPWSFLLFSKDVLDIPDFLNQAGAGFCQIYIVISARNQARIWGKITLLL